MIFIYLALLSSCCNKGAGSCAFRGALYLQLEDCLQSVIKPAKSHPDAVIVAVASRDQSRANKYAKKHLDATLHGGAEAYQSELRDLFNVNWRADETT